MGEKLAARTAPWQHTLEAATHYTAQKENSKTRGWRGKMMLFVIFIYLFIYFLLSYNNFPASSRRRAVEEKEKAPTSVT